MTARRFGLTDAVAGMLFIGCAGAAGLPDDLAKAAREFDEAQMQGDGATLSRLLADDYVLVTGHGTVENKAQFIADYTDPHYHLDPYVVHEPIKRVWNDGAVLGGVVTFSGSSDGKPFRVELRFADVWARRNGVWQVVYTGATRAADQPMQ